MSWQDELSKARTRWLEAKKKGDVVMMRLWERYGNFVKRKISQQTDELSFEAIKAIFCEPADNQDKVEG